MIMEEPEVKRMKAGEANDGDGGDEEMTVQFEDENGERGSWKVEQS